MDAKNKLYLTLWAVGIAVALIAFALPGALHLFHAGEPFLGLCTLLAFAAGEAVAIWTFRHIQKIAEKP